MTRATLPALGDADLGHAIDSLLLRLHTTDERDERPAALLASLDSHGLQVALDTAGNSDSQHHHDIAALVAQALVSLSAGNLHEARRARSSRPATLPAARHPDTAKPQSIDRFW